MKPALVFLSLLLSSCSIVKVTGATTSGHFINIGPITITTEQPARAVVTSTFGVGATNIQGATNIGYLDQEIVIIPSTAECQLILIVKNHQEIERVKQILGDALSNACTNEKEAQP